LRFKNLTLWTNDVDGHIHHERKRDTKENVPYFVFRLDNEVLNGINFRARELSTFQVQLLKEKKLLAHLESKYFDNLCKRQLKKKTFFF
jgi:hypothetical protein